MTAADTIANWTYNQNNELSGYDDVVYEYDANGNMTQKTVGGVVTKFFYNLEDRLERVEDGVGTVIATYYYDPFSRRLWKEVSGVRRYFHYADEGLVAELDATGNVTKSYGYKPGSTWTTDPLFTKQGSDYYFYQNDHLGTPQKLTAINGAVVWAAKYSSFGEATVDGLSTITNNLRFPGQYFDQETGLHYNYFRYYNPTVGKYMRKDPKGFISGDVNLFGYVKNNSVAHADPSGLWSQRNHDRIIVEGLRGKGLSSDQIKIVVEANNWFDIKYLNDEYAYYHSMRAPGQSLEEAKKLREQFKLELLNKIRESREKRKCAGDNRLWPEEELKLFGMLQHPYVDETCPGHAWKEWKLTPWLWNPIFFIQNPLYPFKHKMIDRDLVPEMLNKNAQIVSDLFKEASR